VTGDMIDVTIMVMLLWSATRKFKAVHIFITHSLYLNFLRYALMFCIVILRNSVCLQLSKAACREFLNPLPGRIYDTFTCIN